MARNQTIICQKQKHMKRSLMKTITRKKFTQANSGAKNNNKEHLQEQILGMTVELQDNFRTTQDLCTMNLMLPACGINSFLSQDLILVFGLTASILQM